MFMVWFMSLQVHLIALFILSSFIQGNEAVGHQLNRRNDGHPEFVCC
jgi:hypothetical protein